jgi:hypothetical protein
VPGAQAAQAELELAAGAAEAVPAGQKDEFAQGPEQAAVVRPAEAP